MRMHWSIFGSAWTAEECERELQFMAAAHTGGVLIFPAYPIALDDPAHGIRNQTFTRMFRSFERGAQDVQETRADSGPSGGNRLAV
jgi:hypothetical protein